MGSFNSIGFVSNLPIVWRDKTTLIFLFNQHEYIHKRMNNIDNKLSGIVSGNELFKPMFLPVQGDYADCGRIENIVRTPLVDYIEEFFGLSIEQIIKQVDNNSVGRGDKRSCSSKNDDIFEYVTYTLELTEVYDKMVDMSNPNMSTWSGRLSDNMEVIKNSTRDIRFNGTPKNLYDNLSLSLDIKFHEKMISKIEDPIEIKKAEEMLAKLKVSTPIDLLEMTGIDEQYFMDFISFHLLLNDLNSKYFPSNYGSQDQDYVKRYELLSKYLNIVSTKINENIYENGSDFEDYDRLKAKIREEKIDIIFDEQV